MLVRPLFTRDEESVSHILLLQSERRDGGRGKGEGTPTVLEHQRHRRTFIQDPQLALRTLLIRRIRKNATVQQRPIRVRDHGPDIAGAIRLAFLARLGVLGRVLEAVEVLLDGLLPVQTVPLVDGVDGAGAGHAHVRVGEDELAEGVVHGEAVDGAAAHGDDQLGAGAVHGEAGGDELGAGHEQVFLGALRALG